jgi:hypothetical protein
VSDFLVMLTTMVNGDKFLLPRRERVSLDDKVLEEAGEKLEEPLDKGGCGENVAADCVPASKHLSPSLKRSVSETEATATADRRNQAGIMTIDNKGRNKLEARKLISS